MDKEVPNKPGAAQRPAMADAPMEPAQAPVVGGTKKKTGLIVGIVIAIIVVAAGVGIAIWLYMQNTPESLMKQAVTNLGKAQSLAADFTTTNGTGQNVSTFTGSIAITTDSANPSNGELIFNLNANGGNVNVSLLSLGSSIYVKASGLENLSGLLANESETNFAADDLAQNEAILGMINDQWLSVTSSDVESIAGSSSLSSVNNLPKQADIAKLADLYNQNAFIVADKVYADEAINGTNSAHFSVKFDSAKYSAFLQAVKNANLTSFSVTDQNIADAKNTNPLANKTLEVWIARDSKTFKQIKFADTSQTSPSSLLLTFKTNLPTFDAFQQPSGAMTLDELMTELFTTAQ